MPCSVLGSDGGLTQHPGLGIALCWGNLQGQWLVELKQHSVPPTPCSSAEPPPKITSIF